MPSVLVELGFLSNPKEEEYLVTEGGQDYLASAIFRAFRDYKNKIETRSAFTAESYFDSSLKTSTNNVSAPKVTTTWTESTPEYKSVVKEQGLLFKVQITASSKQIPTNSAFFKNIDGVEEYNADGIYKYLVGSKKSYSEALDFNKQIRELFPDAFIVAFLDGKQIPLNQAINR